MKSNEGTKPTLVASTHAGAKGGELDGDDAVAAPVAPKSGLLPTGLSRAMVIGSVLVVLTGGAVGLFGDRFTLVSAVRSENAVVYRLDRMTGRVSFCSPAACVPVQEKSDSVAKAAP